jgi:hypothetical protein
MFNIPFVYREGYSAGDPLPVFGAVDAVIWVDSLKQVYNGFPYSAATNGNTDIRLWQDRTIYGNDLTATTVNSPSYGTITFAPSGSSSSFPYIRFDDGDSEHMSAKLSSTLNAISTGFTLFFVFRKNTSTTWSSGDPIIEFNAEWSAQNEGFGVDGYDSPTYMRFWFYNINGSIKKYVDIDWGGNGIDEDAFFYYTFRMSAGTINGYIGNKLKATNSSTGSMKAVSSNAKFYVAGGFDGTVYKQSTPLDFAEILLYDGAVPDAGLTTVWNYFKQKYGFVN